MKSSKLKLLGSCLLVLAAVSGFGASNAQALEISIDISPSVLNIQSGGTVVTVHTDLGYSLVDVYSVYLNGILIQSWKADDRGNFVAKFNMDEVKQLDGLVIGGYNTLQMVGLTTSGEPFTGAQDVKVIDVVPRGR